MFRAESLERLSSPEQLDQLLTVVSIRAWIPVVLVAAIATAAVAWSVLARIPVTVEGMGVLINPGNVQNLQSPADGRLVELTIREGQHVNKGEVIGLISKPDLLQQLQQEKDKLIELQQRHLSLTRLANARRQTELRNNLAQTALLTSSIQQTGQMLDLMKKKNSEFEVAQRRNFDQTRLKTEQLNLGLKKKVESLRTLAKSRIVTADALLQAEESHTRNELQLADLQVRLFELGVRSMSNEQYYFEQVSKSKDLQMRVKELELLEQQQQESIALDTVTRETEIAEVKRTVKRLDDTLTRQSTITSPFSGRIVDVTVTPGEIISMASRLASIELDDTNSDLKTLTFFQVNDGKRIKPGLEIRVTPTTVERQRYGAIVGRVTRVSSYPVSVEGAANVLGSVEMAQTLTGNQGTIEVEAELENDATTESGFRWTSAGPPVKFSPGTLAKVTVTVEERAPITYVLPFLSGFFQGPEGGAP